MRTKLLTVTSGALLALILTIVPADAGPRVYVRVGPPAPPAAVRMAAPGPGHAWVDGHYVWNGRGYVWVPGHWVRPPRAGAAWVAPAWRRNRHGWYVVGGFWR